MSFSAYLSILRPRQWLKNLMIFFPPLLSGGFSPSAFLLQGTLPFLVFCFGSSASYVLNDMIDLEKDLLHPLKSRRAVASGRVSSRGAAILCGLMLLPAISGAFIVSKTFLLYLVLYLCLSVAYSLFLRNVPILDVFCISLGFVLRLYAGGEAFSVHISQWLFLTVFLLAIFLSFGKRFSERNHLGEAAGEHRSTLQDYPEGFLEGALYLSGAVVLVTYSMYAISKPFMVYTVPLCLYGLLRFLLRVKSGHGGDPTEALLQDLPLLTTGLLWVILVWWSAYQ